MTRASQRGDLAAAQAAMAVAGGLVGQLVAGKAIRDALFLSAYQVSALPGMMLASALVSIAAAIGFAAAIRRRSPASAMRTALGLSALLFLLEWRAAAASPRLAAALLYLQLALFGPVVVSGFWSLVNERFDPYTAKRLVGRIATGASLGGFLGGLSTWLAAGRASVPAMLLGMAGLSLACLAGLRSLVPRPEASSEATPDATPPAAGLRLVSDFPYLADLALVVGLGSLSEALVDFVMKADAAARFAGSDDLIRFFGPFHTGVSLLALVVQAAFARRALEGLGVAGTVAAHPLGVALGAAAGLLFPGLASSVVARGGPGVLRDSLFRSGYELLYTPLPLWNKRATKALVDVGADKLGAVLGACVVLLLASRPMARPALLASTLGSGLAGLAVARRLHAGYVRALEQSLRAGLVELSPEDLLDSTTRLSFTRATLDRDAVLRGVRALEPGSRLPENPRAAGAADPLLATIADLRSGDAARVRRALPACAAEPALVGHVIPLLVSSPTLPEVVRTLRALAPRCTGQLSDALLDPARDVRVRRRIPRVLAAASSQRSVEGLTAGLLAAELEVRVECGRALARLAGGARPLAPPREAVLASVARELAAGCDERVLDHAFVLLSLVFEPEPLRVCRIALRGEASALRGTALEYLDTVLPEPVRSALWSGLREGGRPAAAPRPRGEVEEELLRSAVSLRLAPETSGPDRD